MESYDAASGLGQETLNHLSVQLYQIVYPEVFKGKVIVDKTNLYSASYDIKKSPSFVLMPNKVASDKISDQAKTLVKSEDEFAALCDYFDKSAVTFSIDLQEVEFSVVIKKGGSPKSLQGSIVCHCVTDIDEKGRITPNIQSAEITLTDSDPLETVLNQLVLPSIIKTLNDYLAQGFVLEIPEIIGVQLSPPLARIENNVLIAYAALASAGGTVLPEGELGSEGKSSFAVFDGAVASVAANSIIADLEKEGNTKVSTTGFEFTASYSVGLKNAVISVEDKNQAGLAVTAYGGGNISAKVPLLPRVSLGLEIGASPKARASLSIIDGVILYKVISIDDFKVDIKIKDLPSFLNDFLSFMVSSLITPIAQLIGALLKGLTIPVYNLGPQHITVLDFDIVITPSNQLVRTICNTDKNLALVTGNLDVRKAN